MLGRRLARRCWPGPLTIVSADCHPESLLRQLPRSVQAAVAPNGAVGLRVPAHQMVLDILRLLAGPVVLTSANPQGGADPVTAEEVLACLGDRVQLILNDGRSRLGQPSTVIKLSDTGFEILRQGVVGAVTLKRLSCLMILLVCTGNTCRSPMAEVMCRKAIADRLGCAAGDLADHGVMVMSAGLSAMAGAAEPRGRGGDVGTRPAVVRSRIATIDRAARAAGRHHLDDDAATARPSRISGRRLPRAR